MAFGKAHCRDDPGAEAFFTHNSEKIEGFASLHGLTIWKYPLGFPAWRFHFLHPRGGFAWVDLYCNPALKGEGSLRLWIQAQWYLDDYEKRVRRMAQTPTNREVPTDIELVINHLESLLSVVMGWDTSELADSYLDIAPSFDDEGDMVRSEFELSLRVPI